MYGLAVGSYNPFNVDTELLSLSSWTWSSGAQYPFSRSDISGHATIMQNQLFILFGGYSSSNGGRQSTIAQYNPNTDTWTKLGDLNNARYTHDVISSEGAFLIVGRPRSAS